MRPLHIALALISASLLAAGAGAQPVDGAANQAPLRAAAPQIAGSFGPGTAVHGAVRTTNGALHGNKGAKSTCGKVWVPGHYRYDRRRVFVPARTERVWHAATYRTEIRCGTIVKVLVTPGHWDVVVVAPARYEYQRCKVWVPGHWK